MFDSGGDLNFVYAPDKMDRDLPFWSKTDGNTKYPAWHWEQSAKERSTMPFSMKLVDELLRGAGRCETTEWGSECSKGWLWTSIWELKGHNRIEILEKPLQKPLRTVDSILQGDTGPGVELGAEELELSSE